ncbi:MAG: 30S ribosomal protein S20 [Acidobacteriota bacterium]
MANNASARKRVRQHERNRLRNRTARSRLRTEVKGFRAAIAANDQEKAGLLLKSACALLDKTAQKGIIHRNAAARTKSRLAHAHAQMVAAASS